MIEVALKQLQIPERCILYMLKRTSYILPDLFPLPRILCELEMPICASQ